MGPMYRHERPQKGRYRQFHQIGVEAFGMAGPDIDAEIILMSARIFADLGLSDIELQINSLGSSANRALYRESLVEYISAHETALDEDSKRRLKTNPLRILDSKNPELKGLIDGAPQLLDYLDDDAKRHFDELKALLSAANIAYQVNPCLVRGLDYYNKTVFEWVTDKLGAQGTICAGGRYDGLVEQLGGKSTPAAGFAMGLERLQELVKDNLRLDTQPHAYLVALGDNSIEPATVLAEQLRSSLPDLRLCKHNGGGGMKNQFKKADKSGAIVALILGEDEVQNATIGIKWLREEKPQITIQQTELVAELSRLLVI
jgi:histidyl-tRNA synthetase